MTYILPQGGQASSNVKQITRQFVRQTEMWRRRPVGPHEWWMTCHRSAYSQLTLQTSAGTRWRHVSSCGTEPFGNFSSLSKATYTVSAMGRERQHQAVTGVARGPSSERCLTAAKSLTLKVPPQGSHVIPWGVQGKYCHPPVCIWQTYLPHCPRSPPASSRAEHLTS